MNLVSIIIPIYNSSKSLKRCLDSIKAQTFCGYEVLLINDGSTDASELICLSYVEEDKRFRYYKQRNSGVSSARNLGLTLAKGEYVAFMDADDWVDSTWLWDLNVTVQQTGVDVVRYGYWKETEFEKRTVSSGNDMYLASYDDMFLENEKCGYYGYVWAGVYRKSCIGSLRFNQSLKWCEDHLFSYEVFLSCSSMYVLSRPYYHYTINNYGSSLSTCASPLEIAKLVQYEVDLLKRYGKSVKEMTSSIINNHIKTATKILYADEYDYTYRKLFFDLISKLKLCELNTKATMLITTRILPVFVKDAFLMSVYLAKHALKD